MKATLIPVLMTFISAASSTWLPSWTLSRNKLWNQFGKMPHYNRHSGNIYVPSYYRKPYPIFPAMYSAPFYEHRYPSVSIASTAPKPVPIAIPYYQPHQAIWNQPSIGANKPKKKTKEIVHYQPVVIAHNGVFILSYPGADFKQIKNKKLNTSLKLLENIKL